MLKRFGDLIYLHVSGRKSIYLLPVKLGFCLTNEPRFPKNKIINKYFREVYQYSTRKGRACHT